MDERSDKKFSIICVVWATVSLLGFIFIFIAMHYSSEEYPTGILAWVFYIIMSWAGFGFLSLFGIYEYYEGKSAQLKR